MLLLGAAKPLAPAGVVLNGADSTQCQMNGWVLTERITKRVLTFSFLFTASRVRKDKRTAVTAMIPHRDSWSSTRRVVDCVGSMIGEVFCFQVRSHDLAVLPYRDYHKSVASARFSAN